MTVQEYADKHGVSPRTVYRWIEEGQINANKVGNMWQVISQDQDFVCQLKQTIERQEKEIEYLREELSKTKEELLRVIAREGESRQRTGQLIQQMQQDAAEAQQRSDTIILQLTRQFEQQTKLLEDMRQKDLTKKRGFLKRLLWQER